MDTFQVHEFDFDLICSTSCTENKFSFTFINFQLIVYFKDLVYAWCIYVEEKKSHPNLLVHSMVILLLLIKS